MIISISGVPGSGKTSVAKILASKRGMTFYSMGNLRGKLALERGITIDELNKIGEQDATTDTSVDDYQKELGTKEDNFVIEGRLSWHFIPNSFKIFLACDPKESARRVYEGSLKQERKDEPAYASIEEAERAIAERIASDNLRYQKIYGLNYADPSHYDLVINTTDMKGPEETAEAILTQLP